MSTKEPQYASMAGDQRPQVKQTSSGTVVCVDQEQLTCADVKNDRPAKACDDECVYCRPVTRIRIAGAKRVKHAVDRDEERCLDVCMRISNRYMRCMHSTSSRLRAHPIYAHEGANTTQAQVLTTTDMAERRSSQTCTTASNACFVASSGLAGGVAICAVRTPSSKQDRTPLTWRHSRGGE